MLQQRGVPHLHDVPKICLIRGGTGVGLVKALVACAARKLDERLPTFSIRRPLHVHWRGELGARNQLDIKIHMVSHNYIPR